MGTIYPGRQVVDLGPPQVLEWDFSTGPNFKATIDTGSHDYNSLAGTETFTVQFDDGAGTVGPYTITMPVSPTTPAAIAAAINLVTAPFNIASVSESRIRLQASKWIEVTDAGSYAEFQKVGLPIMKVDATVPQTRICIPIDLRFDRVDMISSAYNIPTGSNSLSFWIEVANYDQNADAGVVFGICQSNGFNGEPPYTYVTDPFFESINPGLPLIGIGGPSTDPYIETIGSMKWNLLRPTNPLPSPLITGYRRVINFPLVNPGVTSIRIAPFGTGGTTQIAPKFSCSVTAGYRS